MNTKYMKKKQKESKSKISNIKTVATVLLISIILIAVSISYIKISKSRMESVTPITQPTVYSPTDTPAVTLSPIVSSEIPSYFTPLQLTTTQGSCPTGFSFYETD